MTANNMKDPAALRDRGADLVLMSFREAAGQAVDLIFGGNRRSAAPEQFAMAKDSKKDGASS